MKRRSFLQGMAASFAAILTPLKAKADVWVVRPGYVKLKGYLRVMVPNYKWLSGDLDPTNSYGSFNLFLNTDYDKRMALGTTETHMRQQIIQDRATNPILLMNEKDKAFTDLREVIKNAILHERYRDIEPPIGA